MQSGRFGISGISDGDSLVLGVRGLEFLDKGSVTRFSTEKLLFAMSNNLAKGSSFRMLFDEIMIDEGLIGPIDELETFCAGDNKKVCCRNSLSKIKIVGESFLIILFPFYS